MQDRLQTRNQKRSQQKALLQERLDQILHLLQAVAMDWHLTFQAIKELMKQGKLNLDMVVLKLGSTTIVEMIALDHLKATTEKGLRNSGRRLLGWQNRSQMVRILEELVLGSCFVLQ